MTILPPDIKASDPRYFEYIRDFYGRDEVRSYFDSYFASFEMPRGKVVLDLGCGIGHATKRLRDAGNTVYSLDINTYLLDYGMRQKWIDRPVCGDCTMLPFADASFDAVFFLDVLEHLDKPDASLAEIHRVLKPGGKLFLITPNGIWPLLFSFGNKADPTHIKEFLWHELKGAFGKAGFRITAASACGFPLANRFFGQEKARKLAAKLHPLSLYVACPSFWVVAEKK